MVVTVPERLALAREVAERLAGRPGVTDVFVTGSMTAGLGNHTSDVDIYVAGPDVAPAREQVFAGSVRVDVHRLSTDDLRSGVARVLAATLRSDSGADVVADRDVAVAVQLRYGEVVTGAEAFAGRENLCRHHDVLRCLLITRWLELAHYGQEDIAGLVAVPEDADAAVMVARLLLRSAGKAVAAACDDLFPGEKWVWRQLDRSAPASFPLLYYRQLLRADPLADAQAGVTILDLQRFAQTCSAVAATLGWHGVPTSRWPRWRSGDGPLRRFPELSIRSYRDAAVVTSPDSRRVRLSHEAALVWALCDGVSGQTVRDDAERLRGADDRYRDLTGSRAMELLNGLLAAHLIRREVR
jgi:hypothetical protein